MPKTNQPRPHALGLSDEARQASCDLLNQVLADTSCLRDLYKKCHWQVAGPTFFQLHELFDKHYKEQLALVDELAERIQVLGGVARAMPFDVAESTKISEPPDAGEPPAAMLERLLNGHRVILTACRQGAEGASDKGDLGTEDLLVSQVLRTNEMQVWFLSAHLVETPIGAEESIAEDAQPAAH